LSVSLAGGGCGCRVNCATTQKPKQHLAAVPPTKHSLRQGGQLLQLKFILTGRPKQTG
jgi:hypothetical protein